MRDRNLALRVITAVVAVSIVIPALIWSAYGMWLFCVVVSGIGLWEYLRLTRIPQRSLRLLAYVLGAVFWLVVFLRLLLEPLGEMPLLAYLAPALLLFPLGAIALLFEKEEHQPLHALGMLMFGMIYCVLPFYLFFDLAVPALQKGYDFALPIGLLFQTWTLDVVAYFGGNFFGKHPLFPRISPSKTWEGAIAGGLGCIAAGVLMQWGLQPEGYNWVVPSVIFAVVAQLGDLAESMFKRSVSMKDSGGILPGHGGMLDRFDGLILSLPFIYLYFLLT